MKFCAVVLLLTLCYIQSATALPGDWRNGVKNNHYEQITRIVNTALGRIRTEVNAKGTSAAEACYDTARQSLRSISQTAYNQVSSCVRTANTAGDANVCCQQVDSGVFNQGLDVSRDATTCIKAA